MTVESLVCIERGSHATYAKWRGLLDEQQLTGRRNTHRCFPRTKEVS